MIKQGPYPGSLVSWDCKLCSMVVWGHWRGFLPGLGYRLCSAPGQGLRVGSAIGQGCKLDSTAWWHYRLCSEPAQSHCPGSLITWGEMLCSTIGRADGLAPCTNKDCRMGSIAAQVFWPGFLVYRLYSAFEQHCKCASLPRAVDQDAELV